jgi:hypothetical protein
MRTSEGGAALGGEAERPGDAPPADVGGSSSEVGRPPAGVRYAPTLTLREARALYFQHAGFDERTYAERWVTLRVAGLPLLGFPNSAARVRAVRLHDLHHVLTGFDTSWTGEGEIGAWELASNCRDHWAAWGLNFSAALIGLCIAPRRVARAFRRGLRERNLYDVEFSDALLDETLGAARERLGIAAA